MMLSLLFGKPLDVVGIYLLVEQICCCDHSRKPEHPIRIMNIGKFPNDEEESCR
jgi:hypothetical protein